MVDTMRDPSTTRVVRSQYGIHRLVKQIKGCSLRMLRDEFPHLRSRSPTWWANSYFVATDGAAMEVVSAMSRINATSGTRAFPHLPMAKARGLSGAF
jgi:hypothetical protein